MKIKEYLHDALFGEILNYYLINKRSIYFLNLDSVRQSLIEFQVLARETVKDEE